MAEPAIVPAATGSDPAPVADPVVDPAATGSDPAPVADPVVDPTATPDPNKPVEGGDPASLESYSDFTLPEGVELDGALLEKATPVFKELGLNQDQAQKLVDFQAEMVKEGQQSQVDSFNQLIEGWQKDSKNDKEFGGEKFEENVATAKLAIEKFGTPEFKELLEDHGVGSHPEMIRFMLNIGNLVKEDVPGGNSTAASEKQSRIDIMYPKGK